MAAVDGRLHPPEEEDDPFAIPTVPIADRRYRERSSMPRFDTARPRSQGSARVRPSSRDSSARTCAPGTLGRPTTPRGTDFVRPVSRGSLSSAGSSRGYRSRPVSRERVVGGWHTPRAAVTGGRGTPGAPGEEYMYMGSDQA